MVVKSWGLRRTGSLRRAVRVSRRAARGRRAMGVFSVARCPGKCPDDGRRAGWSALEDIRGHARRRDRSAPARCPCRAKTALTDLVGGHVAIYFSSLPPALGLVKEGKVRAPAAAS